MKYVIILISMAISLSSFAQAPQICYIPPREDFGPIEIHGINLESTTSVTINDSLASFTVVSPAVVTADNIHFFYMRGEIYNVKLITSNGTASYSFIAGPASTLSVITSFSPSAGVGPGDTLILKGFGFSNTKSTPSLHFISVNPSYYLLNRSDTDLTFIIDNGCTSGRRSEIMFDPNIQGFCSDTPNHILKGLFYDPAPAINSVYPLTAKAGDTVTITGKYLYNNDVPHVKFGGVDAASVIPIQKNSVKVVVGNGASGDITLENDCGITCSYSGFNYGATVCPQGNTSFSSSLTGSGYQWQVNDGNGFVDILNTVNYTGAQTHTLSLKNIPSAWYGYQYRCISDSNSGAIFTLQFGTGFTGTGNPAWENAANWSCGTIPDANTDVLINNGNVVVGQNSTCRSLTVKPGANVTVNPGVTLTLTH